MNDTTWTCDRCCEVNDISDVRIVEHTVGIGEVVCVPCLDNERATEMELALFGSLGETGE